MRACGSSTQQSPRDRFTKALHQLTEEAERYALDPVSPPPKKKKGRRRGDRTTRYGFRPHIVKYRRGLNSCYGCAMIKRFPQQQQQQKRRDVV